MKQETNGNEFYALGWRKREEVSLIFSPLFIFPYISIHLTYESLQFLYTDFMSPQIQRFPRSKFCIPRIWLARDVTPLPEKTPYHLIIYSYINIKTIISEFNTRCIARYCNIQTNLSSAWSSLRLKYLMPNLLVQRNT